MKERRGEEKLKYYKKREKRKGDRLIVQRTHIYRNQKFMKYLCVIVALLLSCVVLYKFFNHHHHHHHHDELRERERENESQN